MKKELMTARNGPAGESRGIRIADVVLVAIIVAGSILAIVYFARARAGEKGQTAVVEVNGEEIERIELGEDTAARSIKAEGTLGPTTVEVKDGAVRVVESPCREKICVGTGWVDSPGESIICLPNRVAVHILGEQEADGVDTVTE